MLLFKSRNIPKVEVWLKFIKKSNTTLIMTKKYEKQERFQQEKEKILLKADMSRKGSVDIEIKDIVDEINKKEDLCTTSSCAGRVTLLERKTSKKTDAKWLIASHQPVTFEQIKEKMHSDSDVWLMQESCIIHVFCRTIEAADRFLLACRNVGFKRSGITGTTNKIMIESMGNEKVEAIVIKDGKVHVDDEALRIMVNECNSRMNKNRDKMNNLLEEIKKI